MTSHITKQSRSRDIKLEYGILVPKINKSITQPYLGKGSVLLHSHVERHRRIGVQSGQKILGMLAAVTPGSPC